MTPWWSRRLLELIEAPGLCRELSRGRDYAAEGRVRALQVTPGRVSALVEGTRAAPYRVLLELSPLPPAAWAEIAAALAESRGAWGALLGGEMPRDIDALAPRLFPADVVEIGVECTCPVPDALCKHIAAAFHDLAARLASDPLLLLAWRGADREALAAAVAARHEARGAVA